MLLCCLKRSPEASLLWLWAQKNRLQLLLSVCSASRRHSQSQQRRPARWGGSVSQERWEQASAMVTCILGSLPNSTSQGQLDAQRSIWKQSAQGILFKDNFWRSVLDTRKLMGNFLFKIMNEWILKNSAIFWPYWSDFIQVPSWERDYHTGYSFQQWQYLAFNTFLEYFLGGCLPARR